MERDRTRSKRDILPDGFDVICTIGRVTFGGGDVHPHVAAFALIAEHGAEGTFTFPNENGSTCEVQVTHRA